jgi:hypothetical protein
MTRLQAIDRAQAKALAHASQGLLPRPVARFYGDDRRAVYRVPSATGSGPYTVEIRPHPRGWVTSCDCPATGPCWHRAATRMVHMGDLRPADHSHN